MNRKRAGLIASMVIFGTIGLVRRGIPYPSSVIALARGIIGVAFLLGVIALRKDHPDRKGLKKKVPTLVISGVFIGFNWILLFEAYRYTTVSVATVCYYMAPIFMILASPFVLKEKLKLRKGLCAAAALLGVVLVSGVSVRSGVTGFAGILYGLGAAVLYAVVILMNQTVSDVDPVDRTAIQLGAGALALLPYVLLTVDVTALPADGQGIALLLTAGIVHTGFAYALYFGSIQGLPTQTVAIMSYIDPVVALLLSAVVLSERMSVPAMIGVVLVIGAALVSELEPKQRAA